MCSRDPYDFSTTKYYNMPSLIFSEPIRDRIQPPLRTAENMASLMSAGEAKSAAAPARAMDEDDAKKEGEICSICLEALPRFGLGAIWFTCCGKSIHNECYLQFWNSGCDKNCPMCRAPAPSSDEQKHARALRWAGKGKAWAMNIVGSDFYFGLGVSASKEMARLWYEKAAEQEHPEMPHTTLGLSGSIIRDLFPPTVLYFILL